MTASDSPRDLGTCAGDLLLVPLGMLLSDTQERAVLADRARRVVAEQSRRAKLLGELTTAYAAASLKTMFASTTTPDGNHEDAESKAPESDATQKQTNNDTAVDVESAVAPAIDDLIADYDSLSASHVVSLLDSFSADDRQRIRAYEASRRARRTILGKIQTLGPSATS